MPTTTQSGNPVDRGMEITIRRVKQIPKENGYVYTVTFESFDIDVANRNKVSLVLSCKEFQQLKKCKFSRITRLP